MYYPKQCAAGGCKAGMILHGCFARSIEATNFWQGWLRHANNNDIVLVFPGIVTGCWDVAPMERMPGSGISGDAYSTYGNVQSAALYGMI